MKTNDLIYRQAAIEAASRGCFELRGIFQIIKEEIEAVPSAQPEIIRCKDCKFYTHINRSLKVGICSLLPAHFGDDGYCSEAERREDVKK